MSDEHDAGSGIDQQDTGQTDGDAQQQGAEDTWQVKYLPEDLRDNPNLKHQSVEALAKEHLEAQKLIGRKGVIIPQDTDPPEKWEAYYKALGRPEAPDKYAFDRPDIPEGLEYSQDFEKDYRAQAHRLGITQAQAKGLYDWFVPLTIQSSQARAESFNQGKKALEQEWGDKFEENRAAAEAAFKKFATTEDWETFFTGENPPGNDPRLVRFFHKISQAMSEDTLRGGRPAVSSKEQLQARLQEVENNPRLYSANTAEERMQQKALEAERWELNKKIHGTEPAILGQPVRV